MTDNDLRKRLYTSNEYGVEYQNPLARLDPEQVEYAEKKWGINTSLHRTCINCQVRHMLKYDGFMDSTGEKTKKFNVPCKGIPANLPPGSADLLDKMINQDHIEAKRANLLLRSMTDPVAWAELMFGFDDSDPTFHLRSYQKEQLRCTSKRIVIREGRRTGKTFIVCLKLLWYIFHHGIKSGRDEQGNVVNLGPKILVVTPFAKQLNVVFDELQQLLRRNKDLMAEVKTGNDSCCYVKTPYYHIDFANGGSIAGAISGVANKGDGAGGGAMRGSSANILYIDEMDLVPEEVLDAVVKPLLLSDLNGEAILIVTSTPIGKRGRFYNYCLEDPGWKEDYLPSTVLPQWNSLKKDMLKDTSPEVVQAEFMARFIDASHGCFKPSYVFRSMKEYSCSDCEQAAWWRKKFSVTDSSMVVRCIGIDWNNNAGTEFAVVTYIPHLHKYITTELVNIPGGEFTGQRCAEEVIRLNHKWKPNYIYADYGYGHIIIENLMVISKSLNKDNMKDPRDTETIKIQDRLKTYNFSSKVQLTNPMDGSVIEKDSKSFLVENAIRQFEDPGINGNGIIDFPESENLLKESLLHYIILKTGATGKAIYGMDTTKVEDHRLDAFMLALVGIQLEHGLFAKIRMDSAAPYFIPKEEPEKNALDYINPNGNNSLEDWSKFVAALKEPTRNFERKHNKEAESSLLAHFKKLPKNDGEEIQPRRGNYNGRIHGRRK